MQPQNVISFPAALNIIRLTTRMLKVTSATVTPVLRRHA